MHAVKRSPLFRIALLTLAVLSAHTGRAANVRTIAPVKPPCARKVAAAQPDADKKLTPAIKRIVTPGRRAHFHTSFADPLGFTGARGAIFHAAHTAGPLATARRAVYIPPQRLPFDLRI